MAAKVTLKANSQLREEMQKHHIVLWMLADELKTTESTLCRKLRHELPEDEKRTITDAIARIRTATV